MMLNPRKGQVVQVWYRAEVRGAMPLHGRVGMVVIPSRGKPRNHGVEIDGRMYVVPCGNLRKVKGELNRWERPGSCLRQCNCWI